MGDRWWLYRGGNQIQWERNDEPLTILTVFTEADKVVEQAWFQALRRQRSMSYLPEDEDLEMADEALLGNANTSSVFGYRAKVSVVRSRLALMGFTSTACRNEMLASIADLVEDDSYDDHVDVEGKHGVVFSMHKDEILDRGLHAYEAGQVGRLDDPIADYCADFIELFVDSGVDRRVLLALQLESANPDEDVWLDLHDLFYAGYFEGVENITQLAAEDLTTSLSSGGPIIVVTEGVTDAEFLQGALNLVAPHVSHMFRFFDKDAGAELNAAQVVRTLRSFAAAGVSNRVVGVLDNDAAGRAAAKTLDAKPRPSNNRYFILPDVPYGTSYPTNGPSGDVDLDINGRAVAIEFQFGLDALRPSGDKLAKIEWSGREASIDAYQGSLSKADKFAVQRNIKAFLDNAPPEHNPAEAPWTTIHTLVEGLLRAAEPERFPGQTYTQSLHPSTWSVHG